MRFRKAGALTMAESPWRDWIPIAVRWRQAGCAVDWCYFAGIRPTDPFFQQTVSHALSDPARMLFRRETPVEQLGSLARDFPGIAPAGFIFHLSRCGSTLVSRLLATLPRNLVISEAVSYTHLSMIRRRKSWLKGVMGMPPWTPIVAHSPTCDYLNRKCSSGR